MFLLTNIYDKEKDSLNYKGDTLHLDLSFDNVLRLYQLFDDEQINDLDKIIITLEMLIYEYDLIRGTAFDEQLELYKHILNEFLDIDLYDKDKEGAVADDDKDEPVKRVMDFDKDAALIYASFLSEYNIDLFEVQDRMHWDQFSVLLANLSDKTAFKQVVSYRTMKVPSSKDASKEYRDHVIKMKKIYNLDDTEAQAQKMENILDSVASTFRK